MTDREVPEVWWSPSLAEDLSQGGLIEHTGPDLWHQENGLWHRLAELPADAVRLVREEDVDDLRLRLWQEQDAARAAGIPRGSIVAAQSVVGNILMNAPASMSLQEIAVAIVDEVAGALAVLPGDAGAVPDTGQAREPGYERIAEAIGDALGAAALILGVFRHGSGEGVDRPYLTLARILDKAGLIDWNAFDEPSGDTVQAADVASRVDTELMLLARAVEKMAGYDNDVQAPWVVERIGLIRALLGTDTTPKAGDG